jgi:hypothetical protein
MKSTTLQNSLFTGLILTLGAGSAIAGTTALPSGLALNPSTSSNRGFVVRTYQAPAETVVGNNFIRALSQINGTLKDTNGVAIPNDAILGPEVGGAYYVDTIDFERNAAPFEIQDEFGNALASFAPNFFPGIPG